MGFHIFKYTGAEDYDERITVFNKDNLVAQSKYWKYDRESSIEINLKKGKYIVIPSTFEPGTKGNILIYLDKFFFRVFSTSSFQFEILPPLHSHYNKLNIQNSWNSKNSGGSMNISSWFLNDQYYIETDKEIKISIILSQEAKNEKDLTNIFCYLLKGNDKKLKTLKGEKFDTNAKATFKPMEEGNIYC
jgi:hypothetical protein